MQNHLAFNNNKLIKENLLCNINYRISKNVITTIKAELEKLYPIEVIINSDSE